MRPVCRTAVSAANFAFDRLYSYFIPAELEDTVQAGVRVLVPFGRGDRRVEAFVVRIEQADEEEPFKEVSSVLDREPVLRDSDIKLAAWMCTSLYCTFYDCAKAMLPSGLWFRRTERYVLTETGKAQKDTLCAAYPFLSLFTGRRKKIPSAELAAFCGGTLPTKELNTLCAEGFLQFSSSFSRKVGDQTVKMYALALPAHAAASRAEKGSPVRVDVVAALTDGGSLSQHDLMYQTGASAGILQTMVRQGILRLWEQERYRMPDFSQVERVSLGTLTEAQQKACDRILPLLHSRTPEAALLFGVTGSGKTQVYLHLISETLAHGKSAIVLVPEIGLTPQMIRRFVGCFGGIVAVLHSALSVGERYDSWKRIKNGEARVVVGTRSAVFAPVKDLGLLIIDEEQDDAYKSEQSPRYHARDIAKYRVMQEEALLLLGSATPAVETFYGAENGKYPMAILRERYEGTQLPKVTIADLRGSAQQGVFGSIGTVLRDSIDETLRDGRQAILFLNRRGAARQVVCPSCGWRPECPNCSVTMTYHSANGRLMCHYCGHSIYQPKVCPQCGAQHLKTDGAGTQRVEQELHTLFPSARVLRMDADTTGTKHSHESILEQFAAGDADILLGTQMVTKGLDFDHVALVGVIDADQSLFAQDYRARERTFSHLTQVVGRAGRRGSRGHAVIQTRVPDNDVILNAACQDYERFYEHEIGLRQALRCPPIAQIVTLTAQGESERDVLEALVYVKTRLDGLLTGQFAELGAQVLGPAPANVVRVMNQYRYHLTLRCPEGRRRRALIGGILREFSAEKRFRGVHLFADTNPTEL